jgi:hypothetical protein
MAFIVKNQNVAVPGFDGIDIRCKRTPINILFAGMRILMEFESLKIDGIKDIERMESMVTRMAEFLVERTISWDVQTEDGDALPVSVESFRELGVDFLLAYLRTWAESATSVPESLGKESGTGVTSEEASIPMAAL